MIEDHEAVFVIWEDRTSAFGIGYLMLKGEGKLHDLVECGEASLTVTAIPCQDEDTAYAVRDIFGERDGRDLKGHFGHRDHFLRN